MVAETKSTGASAGGAESKNRAHKAEENEAEQTLDKVKYLRWLLVKDAGAVIETEGCWDAMVVETEKLIDKNKPRKMDHLLNAIKKRIQTPKSNGSASASGARSLKPVLPNEEELKRAAAIGERLVQDTKDFFLKYDVDGNGKIDYLLTEYFVLKYH